MIRRNDPVGIEAVVTQQFDVAARVIRRGLVPIIEPEVDIDCADKVSPSAISHLFYISSLFISMMTKYAYEGCGGGHAEGLLVSRPRRDGDPPRR